MHTLGIDTRMQPVYRVLLELGESDVGELAARVGQEETSVRAALARLARLSLVRRRPGNHRTWCAVAPELGLGALLDRQEAELDLRRREVDASRSAVMSLLAAHRPGRSPDDTGVTRLEGREEIRLALDGLCRRATDEILVALPGDPRVPHLLQNGKGAGALEAAPALGIRVRALHLAAARHDTHHLHGRRLADAGAEVRTAATVPLAVTVVDRTAAVVAGGGGGGAAPTATATDADATSTSTSASVTGTANATAPHAELVTSPALVAALTALFEHAWEAALPAAATTSVSVQRHHDLDDQERELLALLGEGLTDEVAARRLGVSLRTVRRIAAGLLTRHGARSRFQLGVVTGQRGWLPHPASGRHPAGGDELAVRRRTA
ncbi:helix-turn-helix domain-containing protein [Streptomyces sp. KLOTTS4A1]|uniref:helix-turn-helix domain-containing protein n=1 Tax=Streptomyces sp. KLOTTS4A1 TaxID=3390996 RepID=UPI0039F4BEE9